MNLQFFADEGAEDPGAAEPEEEKVPEKIRKLKNQKRGEPEADSDGGENTDPAEPAPQQNL